MYMSCTCPCLLASGFKCDQCPAAYASCQHLIRHKQFNHSQSTTDTLAKDVQTKDMQAKDMQEKDLQAKDVQADDVQPNETQPQSSLGEWTLFSAVLLQYYCVAYTI